MADTFYVSYSYREPSGSLVEIGPLYVGEDETRGYNAYLGVVKNLAQMACITDAKALFTCKDPDTKIVYPLLDERVTPVID